MSRELLHPQQLYDGLHMDLQKVLLPSSNIEEYEETALLPSPWVQIGEIDPYKVKAIYPDHQLFIKSYSPSAKKYASAYFTALQELSSLTIQIPILPTVGRSNTTLFFKQGIDKNNFLWHQLTSDERTAMREVIEKYGLFSLDNWNSSGKLPIIEVDGVDYITDPIEDSILSIDDFIEQQNGLNT